MTEEEQNMNTEEAELYDRQIRLWGFESQKKLRQANVLLINIGLLGTEIAKNVLLAGVKSFTFLDDGKVTSNDIYSNFLIPRSALGQNRAEAVITRAQFLNPTVKLTSDVGKVEDKSEDFYKNFTLVIATNLPLNSLVTINNLCRKNNVKFICGEVFGLFGYAFFDFQEHEYCEEIKEFVSVKRKADEYPEKRTEIKISLVKKKHSYPSMESALGLNWIETENKSLKCSSMYFLTRVLLKFRELYQRKPSIESRESDIDKLKEIKNKLINVLNFNPDLLPEAILKLVFKDLVPVASIVGGIIAQEVIKAISNNEPTINNFFLFDPNNYSGKIETIEGIPNSI